MKKAHAMRKRMVSAVICLILVLTMLPCAALARERTLQTVRVGFFRFDGYHMMTASGERSGYGYDILQHMAGYTDWQYEYVGYDKSWNDMLDMLERGEIDLLTSAQRTEERLARFDFSEQSIGTSSTILTVKAGDETFALKDYANWNGMRVGMLPGNSRNDSFRSFAAEHGFAYREIFYDSVGDMVRELKEGGQIDAALTSNLRAVQDEWVVAQFDPSPFYIMVQKGNTALLGEINEALEQMQVNAPELPAILMAKYYAPDSGDEIAYTVEERTFIKASAGEPFTATLNPDRAPFSYYEDGVPRGIINDIEEEIIRRSGLNVRFIETKDRAAYRQLVESGGVDILFDTRYDFAQAEREGYRLTAPYLDISVNRLCRRDRRDISSVALLRESDITDRYWEYYAESDAEVTYYDTVDEVVNAVLTEQQDATYLYRRTAELAIENDMTNRLVAEGIYGYDTSFAVGVRAGQDQRLFSVLNKAVASIGPEEINAVDRSYTDYGERPFSLIGYMYDYPLHMVALVAVLFLIIGLVVLAAQLSRRRKRQYEQLLEEQRHSRLLTDALAAAESADAAKSRFLSSVSHEMRTPLNAIIGFMELAKDAEPQQVQQYLNNAGVAAKQLLSVINDVLDMSSIESGKLRIAQAPFDFKQMIHAITNIYLTQCHEKGLSFETRLLTPVDEWLIGDQLRVNQILINLLGNAVKFTDKGRVWLSISQHESGDHRVFMRFEVSDTGCGMTEQMQARLFKPFEQESATTAQRYGGSGLGLSIVKSLVTMMSGAIKVQSTRGEGSVFTVDLPFARGNLLQQMQVPEAIDRLRVLAVDDEAAELEYIGVVLKRIGVRCTCVRNGNEALAELKSAIDANDAYNICLIDWKMPHMDGQETTRRIRQRYGKDVVVIVVSAYDHNRANECAKEAGANLFISKPLFQSSLMDLFMTLTGGHIVSAGAAPVKRDFTGRRVLLAEDNAMNRMVAEGLIKKLHIACESAADGRIALEKFLASEPGYYDAILMDVQMPNMDGMEATKAIRASAHLEAKTVQIIALTANAFNEDIAKTLSGGMNAHVAKPIEPDALISALDKAFQKKGEFITEEA